MHLNYTPHYLIIPIFQMRKSGLREVKSVGYCQHVVELIGDGR